MISLIISFIADVFLLVSFYNSAKNSTDFLPDFFKPYLGLILLSLIFITFFLSFLSVFTKTETSSAKILTDKLWKKVILMTVACGLGLFNLILPVVLVAIGTRNSTAPTWVESIITTFLLASAFSLMIVLITSGYETIRTKAKQYPFVPSFIFALSAVLFPVITIASYFCAYNKTSEPKTKNEVRKNMTTVINNLSPIIFSFFLSILFELELINARQADPAFSHPENFAFIIGFTVICFYLPIRGFLSLADQKATSLNRWLLLVEATVIFVAQMAILYAAN